MLVDRPPIPRHPGTVLAKLVIEAVDAYLAAHADEGLSEHALSLLIFGKGNGNAINEIRRRVEKQGDAAEVGSAKAEKILHAIGKRLAVVDASCPTDPRVP